VFDRHRSGWTVARELEEIQASGLDGERRRASVEVAVLELLDSSTDQPGRLVLSAAILCARSRASLAAWGSAGVA
jgi:hypothetical protein